MGMGGGVRELSDAEPNLSPARIPPLLDLSRIVVTGAGIYTVFLNRQLGQRPRPGEEHGEFPRVNAIMCVAPAGVGLFGGRRPPHIWSRNRSQKNIFLNERFRGGG